MYVFFSTYAPTTQPSSQPQPSLQHWRLDRTKQDERAEGIWKGEVGDGGVQGGESCARVLKIKVQSSKPRAYKTQENKRMQTMRQGFGHLILKYGLY